MFYRLQTDGTTDPVELRNFYTGPSSMPCWIVGGGPSLEQAPTEEIRNSPCPKFAVNLAGSHLIRPTFWTSYDPTVRFHRSVYLDSSIIKFVHRCRAMDLVPESTFKVCDCPATVFFDRDRDVGFREFPGTLDTKIVDWQDSFIQAIHIAFLLGFRTLLLVGCELHIRPSMALQRRAKSSGVEYQDRELLGDFIKRCLETGIEKSEIESLKSGPQYHFDESKSLDAAIQTDLHYFRVSQYLRLSRRSLATAGLQLISTTANSRLNDDFEYQSVETIITNLHSLIGNPESEITKGLYAEKLKRRPANLGPMRDFQPHFWNAKAKPTPPQKIPKNNHVATPPELPEFPIDIRENP